MGVQNFDDLYRHSECQIAIQTYENSTNGEVINVAIECLDCYEVLLDFDKEDND